MNIKQEKTLDDFIYMEQLELKYYSEEHVTPHQEAYLWHLANPKTGFVLEDNGRIIAFSDILPVNQDIHDQIIRGTYNDKFLTAEDLINVDSRTERDRINLLLSCILVDDDYRETDALKILLNAHLDYYRELVDRGIQIDSIITSNVTADGERFSERMGFEKIGRSEHGTMIFRSGFQTFSERVRTMKPRVKNHNTGQESHSLKEV